LSELGNYNEAIRFYLDELTIREGMKEIRSENVAATLNNIGHNYYRKNDYQKAVEYF
jgi:tetratricopeptide (TPR) repeat protein